MFPKFPLGHEAITQALRSNEKKMFAATVKIDALVQGNFQGYTPGKVNFNFYQS